MPELPEVETTRRGITPYILDQPIAAVKIRNRKLRWPVPASLNKSLTGQCITRTDRRGKYLLLYTPRGCLIVHLGMTGSFLIIRDDTPPRKHDHLDVVFENTVRLRFHDPRRFGSIHYTTKDPEQHKLLRDMGPEPLSDAFNGNYLYRQARKRKQAVKTFIMDNHIVPGVGNIYASESLFQSGIHPGRAAGRISQKRYDDLVLQVKKVLLQAIEKGGTTLRDFVSGEGNPGYFRQQLQVYGRDGLPCLECDKTIKLIRLGQRSSYYCPACQR